MSKLAVAYLRVSTATNQDGYGFERQAHTVREFCLKQGFTLAGEFREVWTDSLKAETDPIRKAMIQVQAVFSELEKRRLVLKLKKARDAASDGLGRRCEGRKGLRWDSISDHSSKEA